MTNRIRFYLHIALFLFCQSAAAITNSSLFDITATGNPITTNITLCLNGRGPASCQNYNVMGLDLSITTTILHHTYPVAGMKINTPGYAIEGCTPKTNGYCLFSVSDSAPKSISIVSQNPTTITVDTTGIIPVNAGSGSIVVTNTGTATAHHVSASLPGSWSHVTQDSSGCTTIAPSGGTCTLTFTSTVPYVAAGNILVTGDNIATPATTALAFSIHDYLVYAVLSESTAQVVANSDASDTSGVSWSITDHFIPGITETSTSPPDACNGGTDGACNSGQIISDQGTPFSNYAAGLCQQITTDNTGSIPQGTWFLPSICQLNSNANSGGSESGSACNISTPSIYTNLFSLGFLADLSTGGSSDSLGNYWASTEHSGDGSVYAWVQNFGGENNSFTAPKAFTLGIRCVRTIDY